ncbi:Processing alpha glucosidase I [Entophlyctis luteolus]|nr:Processing alpha glucosidase I [Entophlyctis luteolus]
MARRARVEPIVFPISVGVAVLSAVAGVAYLFREDPPFETVKVPQKLRRAPGTFPFLGDTLTALTFKDSYHDMILEQFQMTNNEPFVLKFPLMECPLIFVNNPKDVEHILKTKFHVYEKARDGIFNSDGDQWKVQRKIAANIFNVKNFKEFVNTVFATEMDIFSSVLSRFADSGTVFNMQELLFKFTLDSFTKIGFGMNLDSMNSSTPLPFALAFDNAQNRMLLRFLTPLWEWHEWLSGAGKNHAKNVQTIREFGLSIIEKRQRDGSIEGGSDLLSLLMKVKDPNGEPPSVNLLVDYVLNFIIAGRDTTAQALSWVFYLLHKNPKALASLRHEIKSVVQGSPPSYEQIKNDMPYANAVFHEALRLYPSVPIELKQANETDTLPDGTIIPKGAAVCWSLYAMGRTEAIWGDDAKQFRPERWIEMEKQPSPFDYPVFNAGPRVCLGKNMAEIEGVFVLVNVVQRFNIRVVNVEEVTYAPSLTLPMLNGLKVTCSLAKDELLLLATASAAAVVDSANSTLFWGTYRPNVYFGTRTRSPDTLLTGLMWHDVKDYSGFQKIRHTCEQGDNLDTYAWLEHDGRSFGSQVIKDSANNVELKTEYVKIPGGDNGGNWVARVTGTSIDDEKPTALAVYFYVALTEDGNLQLLGSGKKGLENVQLNGHIGSLGDFSLFVFDDEMNSPPEFTKSERRAFADLTKTQYAGFKVKPEASWKVKDYVAEKILANAQTLVKKFNSPPPGPPYAFALDNTDERGNIYVFQKMLQTPFEFDIAYLSKSAIPNEESLSTELAEKYTGQFLTERIESQRLKFDENFEATFHLKEKGFSPDEIKFGKMMLSNMIGGIGYFHGTNIVDRSLENWEEAEPIDYLGTDAASMKTESDDYFEGQEEEEEETVSNRPKPNPKVEGPSSLFTAVPSRPFFPRGFLWDEGFHQLLIGVWDNDLSLEIISSWASKIDENGWVAREQILGDESASKVPSEFQTQYSHFANPPTLLMNLLKFMDRLKSENFDAKEFFTQGQRALDSKEIPLIARRHLDNSTMAKEYLQSVYPQFRKQYFWFRRTQWGDSENFGRNSRSTEAYRWRGRSGTHTLTSGLDDYPRAFPPDASEIHVDLISWVGSMAKALREVAVELGLEKDIKKYDKHLKNIGIALEEFHWNEQWKAYCDAVSESGESLHIVHLGYLNLFPYILGLIPADSPRVEYFLDLISDPKKLWTPWGISSLSQSDNLFGTGENYWRGPIWMNIQYLVLRCLHEYKSASGPFAERSGEIYAKLRDNVVKNVFKEYQETGYTWEQYSAVDGKGQRSHPFTGWTSLVLLMMAEIY